MTCDPVAGQPAAKNINWWMLESGPPQQCMCGYYFRIVQVQPEDFDDVQTAAKFK